MIHWLENRIDPFAREHIGQPPATLLSFFWHFVKPVWPVFALLLVLDFFAALSEVALAAFVAQLIDLMKAASTPADFFHDNTALLLWMTFVVLIARPLVLFAYDLTKNQVLSPPFQTRVRWQH